MILSQGSRFQTKSGKVVVSVTMNNEREGKK